MKSMARLFLLSTALSLGALPSLRSVAQDQGDWGRIETQANADCHNPRPGMTAGQVMEACKLALMIAETKRLNAQARLSESQRRLNEQQLRIQSEIWKSLSK
jgi:hypothetical protein